jgi:hypothetical protein
MKNFIKITLLTLFLVLVNMGNSLVLAQAKYKVGDKGPGGGIIIWAEVFPTSEGWQYIEVAPVDQGKAKWGCYNKNIKDAQTFDLFTGKKNTAAILKDCLEKNTAAQLAASYRGGGKNDWHLPSSDEMNRIHLSLHFKKLSNLEPGYYWTSTQNAENSEGAYRANIFHYGIKHMISGNKYNLARVRAVRYF